MKQKKYDKSQFSETKQLIAWEIDEEEKTPQVPASATNKKSTFVIDGRVFQSSNSGKETKKMDRENQK